MEEEGGGEATNKFLPNSCAPLVQRRLTVYDHAAEEPPRPVRQWTGTAALVIVDKVPYVRPLGEHGLVIPREEPAEILQLKGHTVLVVVDGRPRGIDQWRPL